MSGSGGFTIEDVNAMQDEMNKIGDDDSSGTVVEDKGTVPADQPAVVDGTPANKDDSTAGDADKGEVKDDNAEGKDDVNVIRELREQLRTSNEALRKVTSDHQKLHKVLVDKGLITEEEEKAEKEASAAVKEAYDQRQEKLQEMVAVMEINPLYGDVREVCSQSNMDDIVDAFARYWVKENGGSLPDTAAKLEAEIWADPNPYKKLYGIVKQYHPKYAKKDDASAGKADADDKVAKGKPVVVTNAQASAATVAAGGAGSGSTGWTEDKINALDEEELNQVPRDVYDKYLAGTLK